MFVRFDHRYFPIKMTHGDCGILINKVVASSRLEELILLGLFLFFLPHKEQFSKVRIRSTNVHSYGYKSQKPNPIQTHQTADQQHCFPIRKFQSEDHCGSLSERFKPWILPAQDEQYHGQFCINQIQVGRRRRIKV